MTRTQIHDWGELAHQIRQDHPGTDKPPWKDNAYVCFWDPSTAVYGIVHVSTSPNAEGRRARASFSVNGRVAEVVEELDAGTWTSASISFDPQGHITVRTPEIDATLDLALRGPYADYTASGIVPALVEGEEAPQHFQGAVTVAGTVRVDNVETDVDGIGMRDRTWGFRDESAQFPEYYGIIIDVGGRMLTIMKFARADGGSVTDGFVLSDGDPVPASEITGLRRDPAGLFAAATVTTATGETLSLRMTRRLAGFWVPMGWEREGPTMSSYDELIEVTTSDGQIGHGLVEQGIVRRLC